MSSCSLCGSGQNIREHFHGSNHHQHITLSQRLYMFADKNKGPISLCTIAIIVAVILILKKRK
jgi:hypothetical protein